MKILETVKEIVDKYDIKPIDTLGWEDAYELTKEVPESKDMFASPLTDFELLMKYRRYIPEWHYGFSLGTPTPKKWIDALVEILDLCVSFDPNIRIHAIKIKFGFLCFYVYSDVIEDIHDVEIYLAKTLHDPALKY